MNNQFEFNYSAPTEEERKEIIALRQKYLPKEKIEKSNVEILRELEQKVHAFPTALGIVLGVIGTLIFGLGLAMILEWGLLLWGCIVAVVGLVPLVLAYPLYKKTLQKRKEKYGEEILSLSHELLDK